MGKAGGWIVVVVAVMVGSGLTSPSLAQTAPPKSRLLLAQAAPPVAIEDPPPPTLTSPAATGDDVTPARRGLGLRLVIGGLATAAGGLALIATGVVFGNDSVLISNELSRLAVDRGTWSDATQARYAEGSRDAAAASALLAIGSVAVVGGAILALVGWRVGGGDRPRVTFAPFGAGGMLACAF